LATAAVVLYSIPVTTDAVDDSAVTSIDQLKDGHNRVVILARGADPGRPDQARVRIRLEMLRDVVR
jgi:hypothetical protein